MRHSVAFGGIGLLVIIGVGIVRSSDQDDPAEAIERAVPTQHRVARERHARIAPPARPLDRKRAQAQIGDTLELAHGLRTTRLGAVVSGEPHEPAETADAEIPVFWSSRSDVSPDVALERVTGWDVSEVWLTEEGDGVMLVEGPDGMIDVHEVDLSPPDADATNDGVIDQLDLVTYADRFASLSPLADVDLDGDADAIDVHRFLESWMRTIDRVNRRGSSGASPRR